MGRKIHEFTFPTPSLLAEKIYILLNTKNFYAIYEKA